MDFRDRHFIAIVRDKSGPARARFRPQSLLLRHAGQGVENVARAMGVAPQQRVETIEREDARIRHAVEQCRQRIGRHAVAGVVRVLCVVRMGRFAHCHYS